MIRAAALAALVASPASAQTGLAADCAALWLGYGDYRGDAASRELGRAFRDLALRLSDRPEAAAGAIAARRRPMALLAEAMIYLGDAESRETWESLAMDCDRLGREHSETRPHLARP